MLKKLAAAMICTFTAASLLTGCGQKTQITSGDSNSESSVSDSSSEISNSTPDEVNVPIANFDAP